MNLKHITTTVCPICGCTDIVRESIQYTTSLSNNEPKIQKHANGDVWESRIFLCGKRIEYVPNYRKETFSGDCFYDPEVIKMREKRKADREKVLNFCAENNIEDSVTHQLRFW